MRVSEITAFLEMAYGVLNQELFDGELPKAVITVQSSPRAYGHFTTVDVWSDGSKGYREINLGAETIDRKIENVVATLVHEQVHYWNELHGIKDISRGNTYHNRRFKETAEAHGLIIDYDPKIGYSVTSPSPALIEFVKAQGWQSVHLARKGLYGPFGGSDDGSDGNSEGDGAKANTGKKKSSTRKYQCPECGCSVRATKEVRIGCLDCGCPMELVEK